MKKSDPGTSFDYINEAKGLQICKPVKETARTLRNTVKILDFWALYIVL